MTRSKQLASAVILGMLVGACTIKKESKLVYPPAVVLEHQERHYRTALWCVYTSHLDSSTFTTAQRIDSIQALQRRALSVQCHLEKVEKRGRSVYFKFSSDFKSPAEIALMETLCGYSCGLNSHNKLSPIAAVWVSEQDGLIDSVLNYNGLLYSVLPSDRQRAPWNKDQPYKADFLRLNEAWLNTDLRYLCQDKGIIAQ